MYNDIGWLACYTGCLIKSYMVIKDCPILTRKLMLSGLTIKKKSGGRSACIFFKKYYKSSVLI